MIAVIFEVFPAAGRRAAYLDHAASMRDMLDGLEGFISVERFESLTNPGKLLSLSFWEDETALDRWRNLPRHRQAQTMGREMMFDDYRLRIGAVIRDYGMDAREEAPADSRTLHG